MVERSGMERLTQTSNSGGVAFTFDSDKQENFYVISESEFLEYLRYKEN